MEATSTCVKKITVGVSNGMVEIKILCFRWLSPFLKLPAYEDGTDSVPKHWHIKFRCRGITQKKAYNENKSNFTKLSGNILSLVYMAEVWFKSRHQLP
jgi:hypothetical protein